MDSNESTQPTQPLGVASTEGLGRLPEAAAVYAKGCNQYIQAGDLLFTADQMRAYAAEQVAAERERLAGGNDLEAMCEAFHRLIEAHANLRSPFHQPVCADAQMALRVLRGIVAGLRA